MAAATPTPTPGTSADQKPRDLADVLLGVALVIGGVSFAVNLFNYPLYLGDEGIYMQQAWALLREGQLSPYTYNYDHAPAGWLFIAAWIQLLPLQFHTFGMAVNSGRALMLLVHLANTVLLFRFAQRIGAGSAVALIATLIFSLSPLALFYHRMVLLDNLMVFWVLLSLYLVASASHRLVTLFGSGVALGVAMLTKENTIYFAPVIGYLLYCQVRRSYLRRFALVGWVFGAVAVVSVYVLYATVKTELFPPGTVPLLSGQPGERVSLIGTILWQLGRSQGSILDPSSLFWQFSLGRWLPKDAGLVFVGVASTVAVTVVGYIRVQRGDPRGVGYVTSGLMGMAYLLYLVRGSMMLEFYVVPLLPFLALNSALLAGLLLERLPRWPAAALATALVVALSAYFVPGARDHYTLDLNQVPAKQLAFIRANIPPDANVVIDDDLWVDLHETYAKQPIFPKAHSHWKAESDPEVRRLLLEERWQNIDYLVLSNKMMDAVRINNGQLIIQAFENSRLIFSEEKGDVRVEVRQVNSNRVVRR